MPMLQKMKATDGTKSYFFLSKGATYSSVGTETGIAAAADTDGDEPVIKVEELQGKGVLFRLTCYCTNDKKREVLCVRSKLGTALESLKGKVLAGQTVNSVVVSRKARYL